MSANNGAEVLDRVRQARAAAREQSLAPPGRDALVDQLNLPVRQVRKALDVVRREEEEALARERELAARIPAEAASPTQPAPNGTKPHDPIDHAGHPPGVDQVTSGPGWRTDVQPGAPAGSAPGARFWAWLGFGFGSLMSIAANVLYTWLPAPDEPPDWTPGTAPQVGAAAWPIALVISVEVLSRVRWRSGFLWSLTRYGGAGTVALGSAVISYGHLREVLIEWGYGQPGADVGPLVLDGLMVVSGFALLSMSDRQAGAGT